MVVHLGVKNVHQSPKISYLCKFDISYFQCLHKTPQQISSVTLETKYGKNKFTIQ